MKRIHYIILAAVVLLGACEKPVDFDPGEVKPYVVMISKPVSDSLMSVYVGYSRFFLDNRSFGTVTDATVTLSDGTGTYTGVYDPRGFLLSGSHYYYTDGEYWMEDSVFYGGYTFTLRPQPGDTLRLTATVPGYDKEISATTTMPRMPEVEVLDLVVDTGNGNYYDEYGGYYGKDNYYYKVRFKVKSHGNDDYYSVSIKYAGEFLNSSGLSYWDTVHMRSTMFSVNDPLVNSHDLVDAIDGYDGSFYGDEMAFSSELFQNGEHEFTAIFSIWPNLDEFDYAQIPIRLEVRSLSKELYRYEQTSANAEYDLFDGLFSEPVQVICNIDGGIGVFGGATQKTYRMPQSRYGTFSHDDGYYFKKKRK